MSRLLLPLLFCGACVVHTFQPSPNPSATGNPGGPTAPAVDLSGAPQQLEVQGTIAFDETVNGSTPSNQGAAVVYAFTGRAGSQVHFALDRLVQGVEVTLYGPIRAGEGAEAVTPIARGDGPHALPSDGTYVAGVHGPSEVAFHLTLSCPSGACRVECGADNSCPMSSGCMLVQCIQAPCPSYCEPFRGESGPAPGALGDACGTRGTAECQQGMFCDMPAASQCGANDRGGECRAVPTVCTREYMPVCGCDDQTYPNACAAAANQISVRSEGACP